MPSQSKIQRKPSVTTTKSNGISKKPLSVPKTTLNKQTSDQKKPITVNRNIPTASNTLTRSTSRQQTPTVERKNPITTKSRNGSTMSLAQTRPMVNGSRIKVQPVNGKEPVKAQVHATMSKSVVSSARPVTSQTASTRSFKKAGSVDSSKPPIPSQNPVETLRQHLRPLLENKKLESNLAQQLSDGVLLCLFINSLNLKGNAQMVSNIVSPPGSSSLSITRARRNVESFVSACRELGVPEVCFTG
jgi:hypothetical protein